MATTCKLIAKQTLSATATTVSFSGIPSTFTDLWLLGSVRCNTVGPDNVRLRFNGASSDTNHSYRLLSGNGSSASSSSAAFILLSASGGTGYTANTFTNFEAYIPNYAGSTHKSVSATGVAENNATSANIYVVAGLWSDTSAVTALGLSHLAGFDFVSGSTFYLYGITKA